jgi:hypothetical protein
MNVTDFAWDIFISHASEDKDSFVRPLATELSRLGLRVWYDEFSLQIGDSLSRSIDLGLSESSAGLLVVSPAFMQKPWPKRELAGLVAGNIGRDQLIMPIWLNVNHQDVLSFSPTLADTVALVAGDEEPADLAVRILERVKPEVYTALQRKLAYDQASREAEVHDVNLKDVKTATPIRHETFSLGFSNRIRLVREVLLEVFPVYWHTTFDNFRKDVHPDDELAIWEFLAGIYITVVNEFQLGPELRRQLYLKLLHKMATRPRDEWELSDDSPEWEQRAHDLLLSGISPHGDDFASRVIIIELDEDEIVGDQVVQAVRLDDAIWSDDAAD